jgi:hypothetical protein
MIPERRQRPVIGMSALRGRLGSLMLFGRGLEMAPMASLIEVIATLDAIPPADGYEVGPTIFARKPWTPQSDAIVMRERAANLVAPTAPDYAYLLEGDLAVEVIEVWSEWRGGVVPTQVQAAQAVIHYAEHDAYEPLDDGWPY